jgi:hypothetical protein
VGYIKGKSAIQVARRFGGRKRNFTGEHFWARGYFVSTVGRDERVIREYIPTRKRKIAGWINYRWSNRPFEGLKEPTGSVIPAASSGSQ